MAQTPQLLGYFHHVFGVDTSSSASVAAYINSVIKFSSQIEADRENLNQTKASKSSKVRVLSATYCSYDPITCRDIRVEITFPGSTNVVSIDKEG